MRPMRGIRAFGILASLLRLREAQRPGTRQTPQPRDRVQQANAGAPARGERKIVVPPERKVTVPKYVETRAILAKELRRASPEILDKKRAQYTRAITSAMEDERYVDCLKEFEILDRVTFEMDKRGMHLGLTPALETRRFVALKRTGQQAKSNKVIQGVVRTLSGIPRAKRERVARGVLRVLRAYGERNLMRKIGNDLRVPVYELRR